MSPLLNKQLLYSSLTIDTKTNFANYLAYQLTEMYIQVQIHITISCLITCAFPNSRSGKQCSKGIGYYTQLVWQDTTHVGCGWSQFQYRGFPGYFENFLVCNYGPSANVWKQPVYDIANSTCNCPCIGCNPSTGLCPPNCKFAVWADWASW